MNIDNLIKMANQIGGFFAAFPDRERATRAIADHINRAWEPRMRFALLDYSKRTGGPGLQADVLEALPYIDVPNSSRMATDGGAAQ